MPMIRKQSRYAHSDGHTDVCYSEDGTKLISCGTDGDIRIWSGFDDDDPVQTCVGEWSLCVKQKGKHLQIATDNNNIQLVTFPEGERDGILMRFTAPVNHMAVNKNHDFIGVASEDMEIKIMNVINPKEVPRSYKGLNGPPLSISLCSKMKYLAVSCGDGFLRIWDVETQDLLKKLSCVPKTNSFLNAKLLCRMDFDPIYSRYLAYPNENTVVILNTSDWNQKSILTCDAIEFSYSIVQFSPCGNFIAAASEKGDIAVWDIANQSLVDATIHPKSISICALAWNPLGNGEIAFCDTQGQLGIVINCTKRDKEINCGNIENIVESNDIDFEDVQFEDNDEDNENAVSLEKLKNEIMGSDLNKEIDSTSYSLSPTPRPITPETPLQPPFMPSSTPEHLNPRYMCWNEVGVIRCYDSTEDSESSKSIEVEFHDSNFHNSIMMQNYQNYTMGTLSFSALVVANCNQLNIVPLTSGTKDWSLTLEEEKEEIICIGCSSELVCFATNKNFVRVFGIYGTQRAIFSIPGPLVTLNAFKNFIFLGYHSSSPRKGDQCINFMLVNTARLSLKCKYLPGTLSPESNLYWLGFSDVGTPCLMDSCGIFHMYLLQSSVWIPFCDTTKQKKSLSENFFVVAITESMQTIRGIRCRGSMYPGFTPRPTQSEIKIQPPFIEISTDKSQMEAELFTWENLQIEQTEKKIKETSLKTFALACKNNLDQRALEFIQLLENEELLMLAMKYVSKMNKGRLAEKLMEVASKLKIGEDEDSIAEEENKYKKIETNKEKFFTPSSKLNGGKVVLSSGKIKRRERIEKPGGNKKIGEKEKLLNTEKITEKENLKERKINASMEESICSVSSLSVANEDSSFNKCLNESNSSNVSGINLINEEEPKKPFLKSLKKPTDIGYNPLSLTDEYAGFVLEKEVDKRKKPDTEGEKQKEKQRKLDKFMFSKRN